MSLKTKFILPALMALGFLSFLAACEEDTSKIGGGIVQGEVSITVLSDTLDLQAIPLEMQSFDGRTGTLLLGNIQVPEYGKLNCSFVTRLMCAPSLNIADSVWNLDNYLERIDSCKLLMGVERTGISGDSLAPQKLNVYLLNKQLPSDIDNNFDPEGYYNPADLIGSHSYTVSNVGAKDSVFFNQNYVALNIDLKLDFAKEIFEKYKNEPETFAWPQTFAKYIPGIYVKSAFGKGCVANIYQAFIAIYYHTKALSTTVENGDTIKHVNNITNMAVPFTVSPEVLSSNNIRYDISEQIREMNQEGNIVLTTPGGFNARFRFPAEKIIEYYNEKESHLALVNELLLTIPADSVENKLGLGVAPNLLLVKESEYENFFNKNSLPDNKTSFSAAYTSSDNSYHFSSMRDYILELLKKDKIEEDDIMFRVVPVDISYETVSGYYGSGTTYVTKCVPYIVRPTMTRLHTEKAIIDFSFSSELIE